MKYDKGHPCAFRTWIRQYLPYRGNMSITIHVPLNVVNKTIEIMKSSYLVHPNASFNFAAENGMRKESPATDRQTKVNMAEYEHKLLHKELLKRKMH
jgi:hypothetical protein